MNCANHPDRERVAFCQNCGKPLCQECTRTVGSAVFCEPCLAAKLAGASPSGMPAGTYTETSSGGSYNYTGGVNYNVSGTIPPPVPPPLPGEPNPGLAALLGFIPGVGAMYNGQYAKGVVHLIVFAILVSLANENGIFGLFIAGWVFYQVIEAHHTARARRDGTPLPNPFGLNDLSERLGFGKAWPNANAGTTTQQTTSSDTAPPVAGAYTAPAAGYQPQQGWSNPWESYTQPGSAIPPYGNPSGNPGYPVDPNLIPVPRNRFPAGAIWLIGLGCLFLIGNAGLFHSFPIHRLFPFFLIGLGVWLFVRRMTDAGNGLADDGTPGYQFRLFRALRGSIWVTLVGILFLLDQLTSLSWGRSWPIFIIVAGLMAIFQRVSYSGAMTNPYPYTPPPAATPPPAEPSTSIVPSTQHDQEGR
jgi:B-box zinc finger